MDAVPARINWKKWRVTGGAFVSRCMPTEYGITLMCALCFCGPLSCRPPPPLMAACPVDRRSLLPWPSIVVVVVVVSVCLAHPLRLFSHVFPLCARFFLAVVCSAMVADSGKNVIRMFLQTERVGSGKQAPVQFAIDWEKRNMPSYRITIETNDFLLSKLFVEFFSMLRSGQRNSPPMNIDISSSCRFNISTIVH